MTFVPSREASKLLGVHPNTLRSWANNKKIKHIVTDSGQRRYDVQDFLGKNRETKTICYCRVSSYKQKEDLQRQITFMQNKFPEAEIVSDIGSGINFKRKGLRSVLERAINGDKLKVISAHRDRISRFGFDLIKWIIERSGGEILVLKENSLSPEEELTKDLLTILHVFSCRLHGLRSYKNQIDKIISKKGTKEII